MTQKLTFIAVLFLLNVLANDTIAQNLKQYQWETLECTGEPVARHEAAFIESNGLFYLMGGRRIQEVSIFNPKTNTWTSGAKPPIELHHFQGFSYNNLIYVMGAQSGGYPKETSLKTSYIYNPKTDTWSEGPELPDGRVRGSSGAAIYNNKLYVACGIINGHWDGHVKWFDCYDFKTKTWERLPDAPHHRDHFNAVVCNDKLYLVGGRVSAGAEGKVFEQTVAEVDVYDFKTNRWSTLDQPVITQRAGCMSVAIGNDILLIGGESATQNNAHSEVECLNTKTGQWSTLAPLNRGRHGSQLIYYKKAIYVASGCGKRGGSPELTSIERFYK